MKKEAKTFVYAVAESIDRSFLFLIFKKGMLAFVESRSSTGRATHLYPVNLVAIAERFFDLRGMRGIPRLHHHFKLGRMHAR